MNCKKCGALLVENDQFCKNCGASVNEINAQNTIEGNQISLNQNGYNNIQQPMNNGMTSQPMNNGMTSQSMNNGMMSQPINNGMTSQPMNNGMMSQPMNNEMTSQPMNNGMMSQPMNNGMISQSINSDNSSANYNKPHKSGGAKFVLLGIALVAIAAVVVGIFVLGDEKNKLNDNNNNSNNNGGTPIVNNTNSNYTVKFKGFTFKVPTNLVYETQENSILLGDEDGTWNLYIEIIQGSYSQLLTKKNQLRGVYNSKGYTANEAEERTINGLPFITLEISTSGVNALVGWTKANSMNIFGVTAYNIDNEYDYNLLETISNILSTAEYTNEANNISVFEKVDMSEIGGLAQ